MPKKLEIAVGIATILGVLIAAVALIPAFGAWLTPRTAPAGPAATPVPTVPDPTATVAPSPTPTPESECPARLTCYRSDFDALDPTLFCKMPPDNYELDAGRLRITAPGDTGYEIKPCENLAWNLQFVELALAVEQASGQSGHAFAGIGTSLSDDRYVYMELDSAGNVFVEHGRGDNPSERDVTIPLGEIGVPHRIRIEFTGQEAIFIVDGAPLDARIPSDGWGHWFLLNVSAWPGASMTASLDQIVWGVAP